MGHDLLRQRQPQLNRPIARVGTTAVGTRIESKSASSCCRGATNERTPAPGNDPVTVLFESIVQTFIPTPLCAFPLAYPRS